MRAKFGFEPIDSGNSILHFRSYEKHIKLIYSAIQTIEKYLQFIWIFIQQDRIVYIFQLRQIPVWANVNETVG